jgi:hypothetical protein
VVSPFRDFVMKKMNRSFLHGLIALIITLGLSLMIALQINAYLGLTCGGLLIRRLPHMSPFKRGER